MSLRRTEAVSGKAEGVPGKTFAPGGPVHAILSGKTEDMEALRRWLTDVAATVATGKGACPPEKMREEERRLFGNEPVLSLVSFDADAIKGYLFASSRRRIIEGASRLVRDFTEPDAKGGLYGLLQREGLPPDRVVYAGGGGGLLWCEAERAEELARRIVEVFREFTGNGSCTVSSVSFFLYEMVWGMDRPLVHPRELRFDPKRKAPLPFGEFFRILAGEMQRRKGEGYFSGEMLSEGWFERCETCGSWPAEEMPLVIKDAEVRLCRFCRRKFDWSCREGSEAERDVDFHSIGGSLGRVAMIYGDGNAMGRAARKLRSVDDFRAFSEEIDRWVRTSFSAAVERMGWGGGGKNRYVAPILGGDDVCALVPAEGAPRFCLELFKEMRAFQSASTMALLREISFCFGLFLAPVEYPMAFLFEEARKELERAKHAYYEDPRRGDGWLLSFAAVTNSTPTRAFRGHGEEAADAAGVSLSRAPYSFEDFRNLVEGLESVKGAGALPRSQIHLLLSSWAENPWEGWVKYTYQLSRIRDRALREGRAWPDSLQEALSVARENGVFRCGVADVHDLWEYVCS